MRMLTESGGEGKAMFALKALMRKQHRDASYSGGAKGSLIKTSSYFKLIAPSKDQVKHKDAM
jgi:hypothetical protein